ncbi:MAG: hypothetical protein ABH834_06300 [Candidatus Altiarchaeota archaeon]
MKSVIRKGKKGYVLTWDAVIALVFILLVLAGFLSVPYFRSLRAGEVGFQRVHLVSEDALEVLNKRGPLDDIGLEWSRGNFSTEAEMRSDAIKGASKIAKDFLDPIIPKHMGYALMVGDDIVYSSDWDSLVTDRPGEDKAVEKTRAVRMVSGYRENESVGGWVARAMLLYNKTGYIDTLRYNGVDETNFTMVFPDGVEHEEVAYLVIPLAANLFDAKMNLTWNASGTCG